MIEERICKLCMKHKVDESCLIVMNWKHETRSGFYICINCWDMIQYSVFNSKESIESLK